MLSKYNLHYSDSYCDATDEERGTCCNGCGAKGGIDVPDTIYGLSVTDACNVHDWDYQHGKTAEDKAKADRYMFFNILIIIESQTSFVGRLLKPLRRRRALFYYECVVACGHKAFWEGKEVPAQPGVSLLPESEQP